MCFPWSALSRRLGTAVGEPRTALPPGELPIVARYLTALLLLLLVGCGPAFTPTLMNAVDDLMLPPSQGLEGPNPPSVGGSANNTGSYKWKGKILVVAMPRGPMERSKVHPAQKLLDKELQAQSDEEVTAVAYVLALAQASRGGPGGTGSLSVTVVDWKTKTNLGTWKVKTWTTAPEQADFQAAYPEIARKLKELHS